MFTTTLHIMNENIGRSLCGIKCPNDEADSSIYFIPEPQITRNEYFTDPDDELIKQLENNSMYEFCDECIKNTDKYYPGVPELVHFSTKMGRSSISLCGIRKHSLPNYHKTLNYKIQVTQSDYLHPPFCTLCNKIRANLITDTIRKNFTTK